MIKPAPKTSISHQSFVQVEAIDGKPTSSVEVENEAVQFFLSGTVDNQDYN